MVLFRRKTLALWSLLFFSLLLGSAAIAAEKKAGAVAGTDERGRYYDGRQWGYYWFEDPVQQEEEKKPEEKPKPEAARDKSKDRYPSLKDYTYEQLWYMHPDDFQDLSKRFLKKAVQYPTEENVLETVQLNDIARRKSVAFASVNALVIQKYPEYTIDDIYPNNNPARLAQRDDIQGSIANQISVAKDEFALIMFTRDGCKYCESQKSILNRFFTETHDWLYREANISQDYRSAVLAENLGVERVPSIIAVYKNTGQYMPVSTGVVTYDELTKKIYWTVRYLKGETAPEQFMLYDFEQGSGGDPLEHLEKNVRGRGGQSASR